jgi:hypothetical protein
MSAGDQRRDAGGAQQGVQSHVLAQTLRGSQVRVRTGNGFHVGTGRARIHDGERLEA